MAIRDQETNLFTREFFDEELERLSKKRNFDIGIVVLSIQNENKSFINKIAEVLKNSVRGYDIVARLNEFEFGIILESVNEDTIISITKRIKEEINKNFENAEEKPKIAIVWNISRSFFGDLEKAYEALRKDKNP